MKPSTLGKTRRHRSVAHQSGQVLDPFLRQRTSGRVRDAGAEVSGVGVRHAALVRLLVERGGAYLRRRLFAVLAVALGAAAGYLLKHSDHLRLEPVVRVQAGYAPGRPDGRAGGVRTRHRT